MKVFISHQRKDSSTAEKISDRLVRHHQIATYLDVIDEHLGKPGYDLARYLRKQISTCSHLLAVTSIYTKGSQWVPWEIGVATEKEYPLATFADYHGAVPEFLQAWPYLRTMKDVDSYARAARSSEGNYRLQKSISNEETARKSATDAFFKALRSDLNQPLFYARI